MIKIYHGALDKREDGDTVIRGVIDKSALGIRSDSPAVITEFFQMTDGMEGQFCVGEYQREILSGNKRDDLIAAFLTGKRVPDVEIGVRGHDFTQRDGVFCIKDPAFIVDGLQRIAAARTALNTNPEIDPCIGATIYLDTTETWERERFRILNVDRTKLSPNILIRNTRATHKCTVVMYKLTTKDSKFALHERVQWGQNAVRGEFLSALGLYKTINLLHWRFNKGAKSSDTQSQVNTLEVTMKKVGQQRMKMNIHTFFETIDKCWGVRSIVYANQAPQIKQSFLFIMAELFTQFDQFWDDDSRLKIDAATRKRLSTFPLNDPAVTNMISSSGSGSQRTLFQLLLEHLNKGRPVRNRLKIGDGVCTPTD